MIKKSKLLLTTGIIFLLLPISVVALENIIILRLEISQNDTVNLLDLYVDEGIESIELSDDILDYKIEIKSSNGKVILTKYFQPPFEVILDALPGESAPNGGSILLEKVLITLKLKYSDDIDIINVYHFDKLIFSKEIILCNNNNKCEPNISENLLSCPSDCKSGSSDDYCDATLDGICDQDCVNQGRSEKDIDCTCGNDICDERETVKTCYEDCRVSFWQRLINFIKSIFK